MQIHNGIGYSSKTGALMIADGVASYGSDAKPFAGVAAQIDYSNAPWSIWGNNNLLCNEMAEHIENCGVLQAALDAKARISIGKGMQPFLLMNIDNDGKEELEHVSDAEIQDWMEENKVFDLSLDFSYDYNAFGLNTGSFILNGKRDRINRIRRFDATTIRLHKANGEGYIPSIFYSLNWSKGFAKFDKDFMVQIKALREDRELEDLKARTKEPAEFAFINRRKRNGRSYYPMPLWYSALAWVKVARSVPSFKNAMFANQMQIKYVINISAKYWENNYEEWDTWDETKKKEAIDKKYDEIEAWLTGEDKAYKTLIGGTFYDAVKGQEIPYITVEVIDDKIADGKLLPESSAANSEILFALMMNPALMGAGQPGGPYSNNAGGSNVRESYLAQMMMLEAERRMNTSIFNVVKKFNGWSAKYEVEKEIVSGVTPQNNSNLTKKITPRLVWRFPSGLLTTLDTGKSTKSENL